MKKLLLLACGIFCAGNMLADTLSVAEAAAIASSVIQNPSAASLAECLKLIEENIAMCPAEVKPKADAMLNIIKAFAAANPTATVQQLMQSPEGKAIIGQIMFDSELTELLASVTGALGR